MANLVMKIVIDVDEYEQLKLAASKLAESEKIIKEHLKIKSELQNPCEEKEAKEQEASAKPRKVSISQNVIK